MGNILCDGSPVENDPRIHLAVRYNERERESERERKREIDF